MKQGKVLYVSQEMAKYLPDTEISTICRYLPQGIQDRGKEIRSFMPKYGSINERRNQLHEVIRLSGMNLIIDDSDHPLIIKVASIQSAKMQVYFIDNEDYFQRKNLYHEENGDEFSDNDERTIFFARGVLETVKKLRWSPDLVHCNGWFTSALPVYLKKTFYEDPIFKNSKVIYSVYNNEFIKPFDSRFYKKILHNGISESDLKSIKKNTDFVSVNKFAIDHSDGVIFGSEKISPEIEDYVKASKKPFLTYHPEETYVDAYSEFYDSILD
ncbi:MAG: glycogen/starch synthase [Bacteroidales bacterium]|nr:glycogen/starch synthase [Bacteroidales bacterium]